MDKKKLERLEKQFSLIGTEKISGNAAVKIIYDIIENLTIPKEVEAALKYISLWHVATYFSGSPQYYKQKKIIDDYFEPIRLKRIEAEEKEKYDN